MRILQLDPLLLWNWRVSPPRLKESLSDGTASAQLCRCDKIALQMHLPKDAAPKLGHNFPCLSCCAEHVRVKYTVHDHCCVGLIVWSMVPLTGRFFGVVLFHCSTFFFCFQTCFLLQQNSPLQVDTLKLQEQRNSAFIRILIKFIITQKLMSTTFNVNLTSKSSH